MKHVRSISKTGPKSANVLGDVFCEINQGFADFLTFTGGSKPGKEFAADRCDLPGDDS